MGGKTLIPVLDNWKLFTYAEYLEFIDNATTEYYKDIVNIKDINPIEYYKKILRRDGLNG